MKYDDYNFEKTTNLKLQNIGKIDHMAAKPYVPAAGSTGLQVTSSKREV